MTCGGLCDPDDYLLCGDEPDIPGGHAGTPNNNTLDLLCEVAAAEQEGMQEHLLELVLSLLS